MFHLTGRVRGEGGMCHIGSSMAGWPGGGVGVREEDFQSMDLSFSLSLSTSGEDITPLWQRRRTHFGLRPQVPRTHKHL